MALPLAAVSAKLFYREEWYLDRRSHRDLHCVLVAVVLKLDLDVLLDDV